MKPTPNGICRQACSTQDHETFWDCQMTASFDAGWTNALMQLDAWIRSSMKTPGTQVKAIREELIAMANEVHLEHLPAVKEIIRNAQKGA